ncbi:LacI family DNA-binding transcriptional regulator [Microlunatus soli]|uniref:DNA-binding transcriptional regulator, LacI/PurR family n=1 Tax=Microlunatus soli TaxID=630515 RepID=A0A1H1XQT8_9ACTN|nr:LacI family DNA-binding transcriptional regulator [Microlunatus soli]SDT11585.1 DNA-binding transcriptional regulator, LacI/PurR family [Microlunatus soli]
MTTMREVADRAGVSIATVSFVLNDTKPVTPATRERIETAMAELGFRRNAMARALASRRSHLLALAYPALEHKLGSTGMEFVTGAAAAAREMEYHLVLWPVSNDATELGELVADGLADGVLLMEVLLDDPRIEVLQRAGLPFSLIGRTADPDALDYVDIDFDQTMTIALDHLQELGHQRIALLQEGPLQRLLQSYGPKRRTRQAFRRMTRHRGLDVVVLDCPPTVGGGRQAVTRLVAEHPDLTAIMVQNEHAAAGVVSGLQSVGVAVPRDMSVLSFLTSPDMAMMSDPELTMLRAPGTALGDLGVRRLIDLVEAKPRPTEPAAPQLIPCELVAGETTAAAPSR